MDHAEGEVFYSYTQAIIAYDNVDSSWAKRIHGPSKEVLEEYGGMDAEQWCELETWAYWAQCNGDYPFPISPSADKAATEKYWESYIHEYFHDLRAEKN
jgi:hypothetical protein